jgi:hypothetical protein
MVPNWWKVHSGTRYSLQVAEIKTASTVDHPPIRRHGIIQLVLIIMPTFTVKLNTSNYIQFTFYTLQS